MVVSDHSPCTPDLKRLETGDFTQAWGGISSLQFGNTAFRGHNPNHVYRLYILPIHLLVMWIDVAMCPPESALYLFSLFSFI